MPKNGLYDYRAKYTAGMTEYICPPRLPATRLRGVMNLAERAARALGCTRRVPGRPARDRGRERVRPRGQHAAGDDADVAPAEDRGGAGLDYPSLCEAILDGARLHAGLAPRENAPSRREPQQSHVVYDGEEESVAPARRIAG